MSSSNLRSASKFLSKILRHQPELVGITLEYDGGWADVSALIEGVNRTGRRHWNRQLLETIVATDSKGRYSFNAAGDKIRANQGHSVPVRIEMEQRIPPEVLYHGTITSNLESIFAKGLLPGKRLYVHLSPDIETAKIVGNRWHKQLAVLQIAAGQMAKDGYPFWISANGVWQVKTVPPQYLTKIDFSACNP